MAFFSIIIPTFNSEQTIANCIRSVLNQSLRDFEIIIQDGLSSDNTLEIVKGFLDDRIICYSEQDSGVYDAMNKAILQAQGEWFYFLGSDDTLYADSVLNDMQSILYATNAAVVYGDVKVCEDVDGTMNTKAGLYRGITPLEDLFQENICHQAIFYKKAIFNDFNFLYELEYKVAADYMLNLRLASKFLFSYKPIIIANYNIGGLSSRVIDYKFEEDRWINIVDIYGNILFQRKFKKYKSFIRRAARDSFKRGKIPLFLRSLFIYIFLKTQ